MAFTKEEINEIFNLLEIEHHDAHCELNFNSPFELLIAVILSAQCTDKRVNIVCEKLFSFINTPKEFNEVDQEVLEEYIKPCGFYKNKAKNIKKCAKQLVEEYDCIVPSEFDKLIKLGGVGRKTANVVSAVAFNKDAIAVDTHVKRLSNRIGFINSDDPKKVEEKLMEILPKEKWSRAHHLLIFHGRYVCKAINPNCGSCPINKLCKFRGKRCF